MKKIILVFSILVSFLFSFSTNVVKQENPPMNLLRNETNECEINDSIVSVKISNKQNKVSGFIVYQDIEYAYIVTSYKHYKLGVEYTITFSDNQEKKAMILGTINREEIVLLKVKRENRMYCPVTLSKSEYIDVLEDVSVVGVNNSDIETKKGYVSLVGVCKNCNEDSYKRYYETIINVDIEDNLIGAGVFDQGNQLLGVITNKKDYFNHTANMLDVDTLSSICYKLINYGKYKKNYIKYNLLDVNSLTNHEKYLYSLDEEITEGVLVSSIHYLNYIKGGLNQGMIILSINDKRVKSCYEFDNELAKYHKGSYVNLVVKTITNRYKSYRVKI